MIGAVLETIWEWATGNRKRAIRFFSALGVLVVGGMVAFFLISTRPVDPDSLCGTVSNLEGQLASSLGGSTDNAVFDGLAAVAGQSKRLDEGAGGAVQSVHDAAPALQDLAARDSIAMMDVMNALYPVQAYCADVRSAGTQTSQGQLQSPFGSDAGTDYSQPTTSSHAPTSSARATASASSSASSSRTATPEDQALLELAAARADSLADLVYDERWVAQVASKSVGITDPLQTAANGTHTFYAADILAESKAAESVAGGMPVLVLQSTDFGKRSVAANGEPYWITVVDAGFADSDAVKAWCARSYPQLDAAALANTCAPRTMNRPHS